MRAENKIVIGTRGSQLARAQARMVADGLRARWADLKIETKIIRTSGDENRGKIAPPDLRAGRKGLFTAEIEKALIARDVDLAVHSAKDLPSELSSGTEIPAVLARGAVHDLLVATVPCDLMSLPIDGIVATGSVRRMHQLRWKRADLAIVDLRGNVPTRLRKLAKSEWHAAILAQAGLNRLGLPISDGHLEFESTKFSVAVLPEEIFLPAGGQGIIAMQIRSGDNRTRELVDPLNDFAARLCLRAEREFLRLLHGDCNQPVGVLATINEGTMIIRAQVFKVSATAPAEGTIEGPLQDAEQLAARLFKQIDGE
ncbi:MAG: hydroxymethylbilane synthase [Verrucomicrobiota bacterium]|jgi:hydroxymethylbilane synthase